MGFRRSRRLGAAVAASSMLFALVATGPAAATDEHQAVDAIEWSPCFRDIAAEIEEFFPPGTAPTYECGKLRVPLDHDQPDRRSIVLSLVRLPALDPGAKIGSVFLNPGGPGGSGVDFAVFGAPFLYSTELRSQFHVIGFDPRGIVRSSPLRCFRTLDEAFSIYDAPIVAFPKDAAEAERWFEDDAELAAACEQRGGRILDHMGTADVARDLDLLRQAVGDEGLSYIGGSYGSYLGVTYANLFPDRVRAVVIDGILDPIAWATGYPGQDGVPLSARLGSDAGAQATLEEFFRLCDEAGPDVCAFAPDAADRYDALAAELLANEPVMLDLSTTTVRAAFPLFYGDLIGGSLGAMYDSPSWTYFAAELAFIEAIVFGGDVEPPPGLAARFSGQGQLGYASTTSVGTTSAGEPPLGFPRYVNVLEGFPAVACTDSDNPDTVAAWVEAAGEISFDDYFRQLWTYASSPCKDFPVTGEDRYAGPFDAATANPVLVMSTLYDPATPVEGALTVHDLLPESALLLVDGWGHTTLGLSGCASFYSERYLLTTEPPPEGLVCPQDIDPFAGPPGAAVDDTTARRLAARASVIGTD